MQTYKCTRTHIRAWLHDVLNYTISSQGWKSWVGQACVHLLMRICNDEQVTHRAECRIAWVR
eukprot:1161585-Pelagomonas_calceolata.AAC.30